MIFECPGDVVEELDEPGDGLVAEVVGGAPRGTAARCACSGFSWSGLQLVECGLQVGFVDLVLVVERGGGERVVGDAVDLAG